MKSISKISGGAAKSCRITANNQGLARNEGELGPFEAQRLFSTRPSPARTGYVYFVTDGDLTKIGHSYWPLNRFKSLRSPSGNPMELLAWFRGAMDEERKLHRFFASLNVPGKHGVEWFRDDGQIDRFIDHCRGWEGHLNARRVSIYEVVIGRFPNATHPDEVPCDKQGFDKWGASRCGGDWPVALQIAAAKFSFGQGSFETFLEHYEEWFGPTRPYSWELSA